MQFTKRNAQFVTDLIRLYPIHELQKIFMQIIIVNVKCFQNGREGYLRLSVYCLFCYILLL